MLTQQDLKQIEDLLDRKLDEKLDEKLKPLYEFTEFATNAFTSMFDHFDKDHKERLPERVRVLEKLHPDNRHPFSTST